MKKILLFFVLLITCWQINAFNYSYDGLVSSHYSVNEEYSLSEEKDSFSFFTCDAPANVALASVAGSDADFTWDDVSNATGGYNWEVYNSGDDPNMVSPVASGSFPAGSTSGQATGLMPETAYDFYISADCGATDGVSDLSTPVNFTTTCAVFVAPYFNDFEGINPTTSFTGGDCWTEESTGGFAWDVSGNNTPSSGTGPNVAFSGSSFLFTEATTGSPGDEALLVSPSIDLSSLTAPSLSFWYHMHGNDMGDLAIDVDAGSGYDLDVSVISGEQQPNQGDAWLDYLVDLSAYAGQTVTIRFRGVRGQDFTSDIAIDDVSVDEAPSCVKPFNLALIETFFDSVEVSWDPVSNAVNGYIWEVYNTGDDPLVAAPVSTGTFPAGSSQGVADGLMPETTYDIYVLSDCGATDGQSDLSQAVAFSTTELCSLPSTFDVVNVMSDSAELTWSSIPNAVNGYSWAVFNEGDDPATAQAVASGMAASSDMSVIVTGLMSDTSYEAYITTDCGADGTSNQSNAIAFVTPCVTFVAPYFNDFENLSPTNAFTSGDCWLEQSPGTFGWDVSGGGTPSAGTGPLAAFSGSIFLFTEASSGAPGDEALLVSPQVDLSGLSNPSLSFWFHMNGGDMGDLAIDVDAGNGFDLDVITISGEQQVNQADSWIQQFVDLNAYAGQTVTVRFRAIRGPGFASDVSIDDVRFDEAPSCFPPTSVSLTNITTDSLDVSWGGVANASNGYNWEVYLAGQDPAVDMPVQSGNVPSGTNTLSITSLVDGTNYDFYIVADCDTDGLSEVLGPFAFETMFLPPVNDNICDAIPLTVGVVPPGDTYSNIASTAETNEPVGSCFNGGLNGSVWFTFVAPASGEVEVSTDIAGGTLDDTEIAVYDAPTDCTDPSTMGTELGCDQDGGVIVGFNSIVNLTGLTAGSTYYIQVDNWGSATPGTFGISVLDTNPPCPAPENVQFVSSTTTTADFTWDDVVEETDGYNWFVFDAGADVTTATAVASGSVGADVTTVNVTGLMANSNYDFYVEANCGMAIGNSAFSDLVSFITQCDAFMTPYFEDFETFTATNNLTVQNCWSESSPGLYSWDVSDSDTPSTGTGPNSAFSGSNFIFTEASSGSNGDEAMLESPTIDLSNLTSPALSFWYHMHGGDMGTLHVDVDNGSGYTLDVVTVSGEQQPNQADSWQELIVDLAAYSGQNITIRFRGERGNGFTGDISIDDVRVDEAPSCLKPVSLTQVNVFFDSVELTWSPVANAVNGYIWEVYNAGDDPAMDTPVSSGTFPAGSSQGIADGLMPELDYDIYLVSDCGATDGLSGLSVPLSFTTTELCSLPASFDVVNILPDSAELVWSSIPNAVNGYNWAIFNEGDDPATAQPVVSGTAGSGDTSVIASGLLDDSSYEAYITTDCGADGTSFQSAPIMFSTPCNIISAPYFEDFETFTVTNTLQQQNCWNEVSPGTFGWDISGDDTPSAGTGPNQALSGLNFAFTESSSGSLGDEAILVSPLIDLNTLNTPSLSFWYHMHGGDMGTLNVDIDAGNGFDLAVFSITGEQQPNQADVWVQQFVDLANYAGQVITIRFRGERGDGFTSDMSIDDVRVDEAPPCLTPTGLTVSNITTNGADISWNSVGNATSGYIWLVFDSGADPQVDQPLFTGTVGAGVTSETITVLNPATVYDVYVQSDCGAADGLSDLSLAASFQTLCATLNAPYFNDFESFTGTNTFVEQECWNEVSPGTFGWDVSDTGDTPSAGTGPNQAFSGTNFVFTEASSGALDDEAFLETPSIDLTQLNVPALSFWYHMHGVEIGALHIDVDSGAGFDLSVFTITGEQQADQDDAWIQQFVDLSAYSGQTVIIRFRAVRGDGFEGDISIDDVRVDEAPTCFDPLNLSMVSVTDVTADLTWDAGASETVFDVEIVESGNAPTGVPTFENVMLPFTATGLMPETDYDFYVRADCGPGDESNWVGPGFFTTTFSPITVIVDDPAINETYCYDNSDVKEWLFTSSDNVTPVEIHFATGQIEDDPDSQDRFRVFDGFDTTAPVLYDSDVDGLDLAGVQLVANSGTAYLILESDIFGSCQGGVTTILPFDFDVFAGTFSTAVFDNNSFSYYPNPVQSVLHVESELPVDRVQIYDVQGRLILDETYQDSNLELNLQSLNSGTYLMRVTIENYQKSFRFIKQ